MSKKCSKCKIVKQAEKFSKNKARKDGLHSSCKECHSKYIKNHYAKNTRYYKDKALRQKIAAIKANREWVNDLKSNTPCKDCDMQYPYFVMDFDHLDPVKKTKCVSFLVQRGYSRAVIEREIQKCELVCANCHRTRTHSRK